MKTLNKIAPKVKTITTLVFTVALLLLITSCSKDDDAVTVEAPNANSVAVISGNNQAAFASKGLPNQIEVQVSDQNGNAFAGTTISFSVSEGSVSPDLIATDGTGKAFVNWTLGDSRGEQVLTATAFASDGTALIGSPLAISAEALEPCQVFDRTEQLAIGPNAGTETRSTIRISEDFIISANVNVSINLEHTFDNDLDIFLIAPDGRITELSTDNGGSEDNYTNTVFDGEALVSIVDGEAPFTGVYRPEESFTLLDGISSAGDWTLLIIDDLNGDEGILLDWSIKLCRS